MCPKCDYSECFPQRLFVSYSRSWLTAPLGTVWVMPMGVIQPRRNPGGGHYRNGDHPKPRGCGCGVADGRRELRKTGRRRKALPAAHACGAGLLRGAARGMCITRHLMIRHAQVSRSADPNSCRMNFRMCCLCFWSNRVVSSAPK